MRAIIQGEVHGSEKDRNAILNHDLESVDALLIEGREPLGEIQNLSIGFASFLMGYIALSWIQSFLGSDDGIDLEQEAENVGIGYDDEIDADIQTVYRMVPKWDKRLIGTLLILLLILATLEVSKPIVVLYSVALPVLYLGIVDNVGIRFRSGERNQYMAERITEIVENNSYENVLVVCGQSHLKGLASELETQGFTVETCDTNHWLRYIHHAFRALRRILGTSSE